MADNVTADPGTGGATFATDDDGTAHWPYAKVAWGADNTQTRVAAGAAALPIQDGGNSITIDGTVTANLSATDNAVLDSIAASVAGTLTVNGSGVTQPVSAASLPLPTGAASAANQSTIIGHVDGIEGLLTTIDSDTGTLAGAVSGTEMQVDVVASLPAGNNNIGNVDIASALPAGTNNIGDVDVLSVPRGTSHYRNIDANAESEIKGSAGTLYWLHAVNLTAAIAYLHLYDAAAASVTPGTTTPTFTFPIPTQGDTNGAGFVLPLGSGGQAFANGITLVVTTTTDGSTGDPGTNGVMVNAGYA